MRRTEVLRGRGTVAALFRRGERLDGRYLRCLFLQRAGEPVQLAVGFTVSSRLTGAVGRNLVRRRMRAAFQEQRPMLEAACSRAGVGLDLVFVVRSVEGGHRGGIAYRSVQEDIAVLSRTVAAKL